MQARGEGRSTVGVSGAAREAWSVLAAAGRDFRRLWKPMLAADLVYQAIALALMGPLTTGLLRLAMARAGRSVVADADILLFFVETRAGVIALVLISVLGLAIWALRQASLMTLATSARLGAPLRIRDAFSHALAHAWPVLRLTVRVVVQLLAVVVPFLAAIGLVYWGLLREHDINFFLSEKPPVFWIAVVLAGGLGAAAFSLVLARVASWVVALPMLLFEGVSPARVLRSSSERMAGSRVAAAGAVAVWVGLGLLLLTAVWAGFRGLARAIAPAFGGSVALLLLFVAVVALVLLSVTVIVGAVAASFLPLIIARLHERTGAPEELRLPARAPDASRMMLGQWRVSWQAALAVAAAALALATGAAYVALRDAWVGRPVLVIAHRGAAAVAPENTLAAFRRAIEDRADIVELDVQESSDGVVVVIHDSDLMKVAGVPSRIWETSAEALRQVDVGAHYSPEFRGERVPTLSEALALCKGKARVDIELKSYGHDQRLEERVVELVEAAGVEREIVTMSLDHDMVRTMQRLRPEWTAGLLTARAMGDLTDFPADFLAVEAGMATRRFVRRAHRAGKSVYVWTVNDPPAMLEAISRGVDGLITDNPALAREVVDRHAALDKSQRLLVALLVGFGREEKLLTPEGELRP